MSNEKEVLLSVRNLCQYFKMGPGRYLKAVDNVNFDVYKGEVFGLVGESGCGKTTTGRTIIKLYNATGGEVFFKGRRIVAGDYNFRENIKVRKEEVKVLIENKKAELKEKLGANPDPQEKSNAEAQLNQEISQLNAELNAYVKEQRAEIKRAKIDQKKCDKLYAQELVEELQKEKEEKLASVSSEEEKKQLNEEYNEKIRIAKRERLVTKIQMIFQDPISSLDPRMTVKDIISEGLIIKGIKDKEYITETVYKALDQVGLVQEHATRYPHEFSGGQRQRIGVARSMVMKPDIIIADEPVSALDVSIQAQVINLLNDLRNELGLTILFIAHDLSVVKYFSDRIAVMYYGKIVELTTSDELFDHPLHPYTRSLLSAIPLPDPVYEKQRKRIVYNPVAAHNYAEEGPTLREVVPGHFVLCNTEEFNKYVAEVAEIDRNKQKNN